MTNSHIPFISKAKPLLNPSVFFLAQWAGDVLRNFTTAEDGLLDEIDGETAVSFYDVLHRHDQLVTPHLQTLRHARQQNWHDDGWQTEQLHHLLAAMFQLQHQVHHRNLLCGGISKFRII